MCVPASGGHVMCVPASGSCNVYCYSYVMKRFSGPCQRRPCNVFPCLRRPCNVCPSLRRPCNVCCYCCSYVMKRFSGPFLRRPCNVCPCLRRPCNVFPCPRRPYVCPCLMRPCNVCYYCCSYVMRRFSGPFLRRPWLSCSARPSTWCEARRLKPPTTSTNF